MSVHHITTNCQPRRNIPSSRLLQAVENSSVNVKANFYTLLAVTGVVLFWRGIWQLWDSFLGQGVISNVASLLVGLAIMTRWVWLIQEGKELGRVSPVAVGCLNAWTASS